MSLPRAPEQATTKQVSQPVHQLVVHGINVGKESLDGPHWSGGTSLVGACHPAQVPLQPVLRQRTCRPRLHPDAPPLVFSSLPTAGHLQLDRADPGRQLALVRSVPVTAPPQSLLARPGPEAEGHLGLKSLVQDRLQKNGHPSVASEQLADLLAIDLDLKSSHRGAASVVGLTRYNLAERDGFFYPAKSIAQLIGHNLVGSSPTFRAHPEARATVSSAYLLFRLQDSRSPPELQG